MAPSCCPPTLSHAPANTRFHRNVPIVTYTGGQIFIISTVQIFQRGPPGSKAHLGWAFLDLVCITYFFSIFGVWFVHSLLLDDDLMHDNAVKLYSDCDSVGGRESPPVGSQSATKIDSNRTQSPTLGAPGSQSNISGGNGHGNSSFYGYSHRDPVGRQQCSLLRINLTSSREAMRDLRSANDRLARARNLDDAWGLSGLLWRLTESGSVSVDMLRETRIGRTTGIFCKRTCGRCGSSVCDWCTLIAVWKKMAYHEIGRGDRRDGPSDGCNTASNGLSPGRHGNVRSGRHLSGPTLVRNAFPSMPAIPEIRERTESSESSNSELDRDIELVTGRAAILNSRSRERERGAGSRNTHLKGAVELLPPASPPRSKSLPNLRG